jgi:hypothetical protein
VGLAGEAGADEVVGFGVGLGFLSGVGAGFGKRARAA